MWDLIVSVPDHRLSFYFVMKFVLNAEFDVIFWAFYGACH